MAIRSILGTALTALSLVALPTLVQGQPKYGPGASDTEIVLGQTMAYSGPASAFGQIGRATSAYLDKVNAEGGINGRKVRLVSLDDGFSPPKTVEQTRRLVEQEKVLAIVGSLGSATNISVHRYLNQIKVPQLFILTGLSRWNDPKQFPMTMGFLPSYLVEGRVFAQYVRSTVAQPKVAILYQNDDAGKETARGMRDGLGDKADAIIVKEASFEVTDPTVDSQVISLAGSGANVFLIGASPKATAQALRKADEIGWKPLRIIANAAASVSATLAPAGLELSVGVVSDSWGKDPTDRRWADDAGFKAWTEWMRKYNPQGNVADVSNVIGYTTGQLIEHVLRQCGNDLTRENLLRQATSIRGLELPMLVPGIRVNTTPQDYRMVKQLQLQRFNGKEWELIGGVVSGGD